MRRCVVGLVVLLLSASSAFAQLVTRVVDGDTIHVEGIGSVRLIGIDTRETVDPRKPVEFFAKESSAFTSRMVQGKVVRLEFDFQRKDKYDRTLAYVYLSDGTFVNAKIVKQGFGHAYTQFPFKFLDEFRSYEREAREGYGARKAPLRWSSLWPCLLPALMETRSCTSPRPARNTILLDAGR